MRVDHLWLKRMMKLGLILMMGVSMSACSGSTKWKEEVQLGDGHVIVVERETIREGGGDEWAFNRSGSKPKEYRIRFTNPDGSGAMIEWRSNKISPATWPEVPLAFDMVSGQPIVFSLVAISIGCRVYSKYVYQNSSWVEEPLSEQFEQRTTNLLIFDDKDMRQFVNLETKRVKNADSHTKGYRQVGPTRKVCG